MPVTSQTQMPNRTQRRDPAELAPASATIIKTKIGLTSSKPKLWPTKAPASGQESSSGESRATLKPNDCNFATMSRSTQALTETSPLLKSSASITPATSYGPSSACEQRNGQRQYCCRDSAKDDKSGIVSPEVARDVIIGLSDGLTVPFALTAGLSGVGSSRIVVLAGLAELVSGAISMGVGGLLSAQAEVAHYRHVCESTRRRVSKSCGGEMEREVCAILEPYGVPSDIAGRLAQSLENVELAGTGGNDGLPLPACADASAASGPGEPVQATSKQGLTPFIVQVGEKLEKVEDSRVWQSAALIGSSYFVGGFIPLLPYIIFEPIQKALFASIVVTGITLVIFGIVKQRCAGGPTDPRGLAWAALSTLLVGAAAAGSSFAIVRALEG